MDSIVRYFAGKKLPCNLLFDMLAERMSEH